MNQTTNEVKVSAFELGMYQSKPEDGELCGKGCCQEEAVIVAYDPDGRYAICEKHVREIYSIECPHCQKQVLGIDSGSSEGFAGPIYWTRLECGHYDVDTSSDVPQA